MEYARRTWDIEYSKGLCEAIEDDYVINAAYYSDDFFSYMGIMEPMLRDNWRKNNLSDNEMSPSELLRFLKEIFNQY